LNPVPSYSEFHSGPAGHAYNEAAFRYFLAADRRRAERSMRSLLLVLVTLQESANGNTFPNSTAAAIFGALGGCVREVDFVGWYREGRVAGAVLAQGVKITAEVRDRTAIRIQQALRKTLTPGQLMNVRVRIVRLGGRKSR
jgi:hypothetical protein